MTPALEFDSHFKAHLDRILEAIGASLHAAGADWLVVHAGLERLAFLDDQPYPYRPNPWFTWMAPVLRAPGSLILWRDNKKPVLYFVSPVDYWHAPPAVPREPWTREFELVSVADAQSALAALPGGGERVCWIGEPAPPYPGWLHNPAQVLLDLEQLRCRKTPYEVDCLREATRLGVAGHLAAEKAFRAGGSELAIHLAFLQGSRQSEAALPYGNIVALNENAATLHYQYQLPDAPEQRHSLLIDAGASCRGYASDITRTYAANPGLFASLIDGMHGLQQQLCARVAPGVDWRELHLAAHLLVARLLRDAGVLRVSGEDAVAMGISSTFLPHGLGHLLGLQVHDVGGFRASAQSQPIERPPGHNSLRLTRRLETGMVVTVEPGLYFIDSLLQPLRAGPHAQHIDWSLIETLRPCGGIRIEDDVLVTAAGHENLTRAAFAAAASAPPH
jgi:Xaa-Pro dipeptidase